MVHATVKSNISRNRRGLTGSPSILDWKMAPWWRRMIILAGLSRNHESEEALTSVYRSEDNGLSWQNVTHVMNAYWSTLFIHRGVLYLFGVTQQYGSIVIRRR